MPKVLNFKVLIEQDEDGIFVASVPAVPGCHTQGKTYEEALNNIQEAIELCLAEAAVNKGYSSQIDWPAEDGRSRFLGVTDLPIRFSSAT